MVVRSLPLSTGLLTQTPLIDTIQPQCHEGGIDSWQPSWSRMDRQADGAPGASNLGVLRQSTQLPHQSTHVTFFNGTQPHPIPKSCDPSESVVHVVFQVIERVCDNLDMDDMTEDLCVVNQSLHVQPPPPPIPAHPVWLRTLPVHRVCAPAASHSGSAQTPGSSTV